jgi:hypothetical protein
VVGLEKQEILIDFLKIIFCKVVILRDRVWSRSMARGCTLERQVVWMG